MYKDIKYLPYPNVCYGHFCYSLRRYKQTIEKVVLYRKHNIHGRLISQITIYTHDKNKTLIPHDFRLYDDDYVWFLNELAEDFPEVPLEDLSNEKDKLVKSDAE